MCKSKSITKICVIAFMCFLLSLETLCLEGCSMKGLTKESITRKALKDKYEEDFSVYEFDVDGPEWYATVSPINNPEILFNARIRSDGTVSYDNYFKAYVGYQIEDMIRKDLESYFPGAYIFISDVWLNWKGDDKDFRLLSIEEIMDNSDLEAKEYYEPICFLEIYIDSSKGTNKKYQEEYNYFTDTVNELVGQKRMLPVCVHFWKVDEATLERVKEYCSRDLDYLDGLFVKEALNIDKYVSGIRYPNQNDLGNPSNMVSDFNKIDENYIGSYEEYLRRRELFENGK